MAALWYALLLLSAPYNARAAAPPVLNKAVAERKAATVYNLCKFIRWPEVAEAAPPEHFTICVPEDTALLESFRGMEERRVGGLPVRVAPLADSGADLGQCQVLFLPSDAAPLIGAFLARAAALPLLTVSDLDGFADRNGMIELIRAGDRVRFAINVDVAKQAGLTIAAPLLGIAAHVRQEKPGVR